MSDTQTEADTKSGVGSTQALHATILAANDMFYQKFEERFGTEPELLPMFILVGPDGSTVPITGDQFDMDPAVLSQIMKATGTVRYGFTAEAWQASQTAPFKPGDKRPSERDDRIEVVVALTDGIDEEPVVSVSEIIRDWNTGKVLDLKPMDLDTDGFGGQWLGLLK